MLGVLESGIGSIRHSLLVALYCTRAERFEGNGRQGVRTCLEKRLHTLISGPTLLTVVYQTGIVEGLRGILLGKLRR